MNVAYNTEDGLDSVRAHLAPGGVLAVWSSAASPAFRERLERAFDDVRVEAVTFFIAMVHEETTHWIFLARK